MTPRWVELSLSDQQYFTALPAEEIRDGFAGRQGQTGASDRGLEGKDIEHDSQRFALGSCPFVPRSFKRTISLFPFDFRNACKRIVSLDILP